MLNAAVMPLVRHVLVALVALVLLHPSVFCPWRGCLRPKSAEAKSNLSGLRTSMESYRAEFDVYPPLRPTPPWPPSVEKRKAPDCLAEDILCPALASKRLYYVYACEVVGDAAGPTPPDFTCVAVGDLDADGVFGAFLYGTNNRGGPAIVAPIPAIAVGLGCAVHQTPAGELFDCHPGVF